MDMIYSVWGFILVGLMGGASNWYVQYAKGRIDCGFIEYLSAERKHTLSSTITIVMGTITLFATTPPAATTWSLALALLGGYMSDNAINKAPDAMTTLPQSALKKQVHGSPQYGGAPGIAETEEDFRTLSQVAADDRSY